MRPSCQFFAVSVGVLVAFGQAVPGVAQIAQATTAQDQDNTQTSDSAKQSVDQPDVEAKPAPTSKAPTQSNATVKAAQEGGRQASDAQPSATPQPAKQETAQTPPSAQTSPPVQTTPTQSSPLFVPSTTPGTTFGTSPTEAIIPSKPIGPAKEGAPPEYLNPAPNPLFFPTKPEEVKLRGIQPITLEQALELAKRNNRDLQIAIQQLKRSQAALRQQQAALYPNLSAQGNITQSQSAGGQLQEEAAQQAQENLPRRLRNIPNSDRDSLGLTGTVALSYDVYTSGRRPALIRAAEQQLRTDQLQVEVTENQIRLNVKNAYYNLQEADENVRIQQSAVRNAEASLRDTQAQERAGLGTRFDVLQSQVQLADAQQRLTEALGNQQIRRRELAQILALPPMIDLAAADPVKVAGSWNLSLPESVVLALKNRAELEQFLAQREQAEQNRKAALAALGPTVSLQVQYNVSNNLRDTLGFGDGYSVAAGFNWNFFDGGAARASANQQEANKAIAETRFAQTRENIQLQVESAYTTLQFRFTNIGTSRQAVIQATEALRLARLRFQAGVGTQTEVINAENALTQQEGRFVNAIIGYNRALASLQREVTNLPIPTGSNTPSIPAPAPDSGLTGD